MQNKIKEVRRMRKRSQKYIAEKSNVSERYFQDVENGISVPTAYIAIAIANALETTVEELFPIVVDVVKTEEKQFHWR